eukprot:symbB.v1.2.005226.t1/scaffold293.1/size237565/7
MVTWAPSSVVGSLPLLERGEGVYVYDTAGKKYLDWTSEAVCVNLGHTVPDSVKQAMNEQLDQMPFAYSGIGLLTGLLLFVVLVQILSKAWFLCVPDWRHCSRSWLPGTSTVSFFLPPVERLTTAPSAWQGFIQVRRRSSTNTAATMVAP